MSRILILDPLQHFPSCRDILIHGEGIQEITYATYFDQDRIFPHVLYSPIEDFQSKYGFTPHDLATSLTSNCVFDIVYIVYPSYFYWFDDESNNQSLDLFQRILSCAEMLGSENSRYVLIDNHDYPHDPTLHPIVKNFEFDKILKREMRIDRNYHPLVEPFPFVIFGHLDPIFFFLNKKRRASHFRINKIFWAGSPLVHKDPSAGLFVNRRAVLDEILREGTSHFKILKHNIDFEKYLKKMRRYQFFLDLTGVGQLTKRFFEGLALGCVPLIQKNSIKFPPEFIELENFLHELQWENVLELNQLYENISKKHERKRVISQLNHLVSQITKKNLANLLLKNVR